tara:strand:+ start:1771 stop:2973 length:1203 start_codon:yes stop_codon:yes gene_type:complete
MEVLADQRVDEVSISLEELQNDIDINRLRHHVYVLASQEMKGRDVGSNEAERAISYIENKFKSYGLQPWFGEDYKQPITTGAGANVVALLPGFDPKLRHELVLVTAHHDHLGIREGLIYPGADDNISSVALMLETARILAKHSRVVKRSILFISFDAEEKPEGGTDKMGSGFFVNQLSNDNRQRIVLMIGMDLMAGEVIPALPGALFIMGAEKSLHLSRLIQSRTPIDGLNPVPLGLAMIEAVPYCPWCQHSVSDYDSFRQADIPFVFLSTGRSQYYHTPADTPSSLHYKKIERNAAYLLGLTLGAANDLEWINDYDHHAQDQSTDIASVASVLDAVLKQPPEGIRWDTFKSLHKAQDTVTEFSEKTDPLSWFEYRRLQSISLQMQCAVAKPSWRICPWF